MNTEGNDDLTRATSTDKLVFLTKDEVKQALSVDELILVLEAAFTDLSAGRVSVPPRVAAVTPDGSFLAAMPGFVDQTLAAKLVSVFPRNHALGLPSHQAVVVLFDANTGTPRAFMDGSYITAIRTGASSALATRMLARTDAEVLTILGAGVQGEAHLQCVPRVRQFKEIRLASRNMNHAMQLAERFPGVRVANSFEEAVRGADVVCACTNASSPVIERGWLKAGAHVNSVGFGGGPELDAATILSGRVFVESRAVFQPFPVGAHEFQGLDRQMATELGEVLSGAREGRRGESEVTVYKSAGHAVEDAVAAKLAYETATKAGLGTMLPLLSRSTTARQI